MLKKKRICFILVFIFFLSFPLLFAGEKKDNLKVFIFQSPLCSRCAEIKKSIMPAIEKEYKGKVNFDYLDVTDVKNYKFLLGLREEYGSNIELALPVFFVGGSFLNGNSDLKNMLPIYIEGSFPISEDKINSTIVDLVEHFKTFKPLVIVGSGLADGINPCAFTVIVFFISYLALQGYRKRELLMIGFGFIGAVFATYTFIGLGVFNFLYRLKAFWFFSKALNIGVGVLSILLGVFTVYDIFKFKMTEDTEGMILQLPSAIKKRIHSIIGLHYRKSTQDSQFLAKPPLFRLLLSALITGFLVSLLEAVCTGQLYLPTIAYVLKTTPLKLQAFLYLIVYNIMFILPLLAIFAMALLGVGSNTFSLLLKKRLPLIKALMALFFFSLGVLLIWRG